MYLEHFGLAEPPFRITPHTEFFFAGANRGATLEALIYAITHDEGIVKVSGEVGSGKTMLCRVLMERLPEHVVVVYLANPSLSREDMVFTIADELELRIPENTRISAAIRALQGKLIELHSQGRQVVVLIDEAHAMPLETLEEIRLLSNLETNQHKLLQLVLFGQPELDGVLARPDMRQLKERITHNFVLEPLHRDDIARYVDFRMRTAGYRGPEVFSPNAIKMITGTSQGLTRRVNILAEKSLLAAYAEGVHQITPKQVDAAIRDCQYEKPGQEIRRRLLMLTGIVLIIVLAVVALRAGLPDEPSLPASSPAATSPVSSTTDSAGTSPTRSSTPAKTKPSEADESVPAQVDLARRDSPPSLPSPPEPPANTAVLSQLGPEAEQRLQETRKWINATEGSRWFIQLTATNTTQMAFVKQFLEKADRMLQPEHTGLYIADTGKELRIGIIFGDFDSRQAAAQAIARLPEELRANKPFPRQVIRLK